MIRLPLSRSNVPSASAPFSRALYDQNRLWQKGACLTKGACSANRHCIGLYRFCIGFGQIIDF